MSACPVVSVIIATRNRPTLLAAALESVARQTLRDYEVLVIDDGSELEHQPAYDALFARLGAQFRYVRTAPPSRCGSGPSLARNRGLDSAQGRYVAFLDDDDAWTWDDHLRAAIETLDETGEDLYCGNMQAFRSDVLVVPSWVEDAGVLAAAKPIHTTPPVYRVGQREFLTHAKRRVIHPNMLVVRRMLVNEIGGFAITQRFGEDAEFVLRLLDRTDSVLYCPVVVARYRVPEGDSHSLTMTRVEQDMQMLAAARRVGIVARSAAVRHAAADIEGWSLRTLSRHAKAEGRTGTAVRLSLQAFVACPTAGALADVARSVLPLRFSSVTTPSTK
jgi:cellulose synthase/poly-beta-1,6-N-acetylglucosamine synthase-like glycosyltransferase